MTVFQFLIHKEEILRVFTFNTNLFESVSSTHYVFVQHPVRRAPSTFINLPPHSTDESGT